MFIKRLAAPASLILLSILLFGCQVLSTPAVTPDVQATSAQATFDAIATENAANPTKTPEPTKISVATPSSLLNSSIQISITYAPEERAYVPYAIEAFNKATADGVNPVTDEKLPTGAPIVVTGIEASSGQVAQQIIQTITTSSGCQSIPTIFSPSVSDWLALINYRTGKTIFSLDENESPPTAIAPVVIAIWESRLKAIQDKNGGSPVGWQELLAIFNSTHGWGDYMPGGRSEIYYGHTDPQISSTGLSTLIAEFYASASVKYADVYSYTNGLPFKYVNDSDVKKGVRAIEKLILHYAPRTTEFKQYIAQGPDYVDFVALEENDLLDINRGLTTFTPPEGDKLVALYPKEGTFLHKHPFAIPTHSCISAQQREAAKLFTRFVRENANVQTHIKNGSFRSWNPKAPPSEYITKSYGVDPNQPVITLAVPAPRVIAEVQSIWPDVKKRSDILLLIDTSSSMNDEGKLKEAKQAVQMFLNKLPQENYVGIMTFASKPITLANLTLLEGGKDALIAKVNTIEAKGNTTLYQGILDALKMLESSGHPNTIKAIVLLSDGKDTGCQKQLPDCPKLDPTMDDMVSALEEHRLGRNSIIVFPIAYGADADKATLGQIGHVNRILVREGKVEDIEKILEELIGLF
ncbi:MAG: extracellular solute-binding protein [Caldilineaceae bacterium]